MNTRLTKDIVAYYIDEKTGEVIDGENCILISKENFEKQTVKDKNKADFIASLNRKKQSNLANNNENFVFYLFREYKKFDDLKPQDAIRLMYLATYLEYDTNYLQRENEYLTKKDIANIMKLNRATFKTFYNSIIEKNYLIKCNEGYKLSEKHFHKGTIETDYLIDKRFIRVYINAFRKLYNSVKTTDHVYLGYIIDMIPYINMQWNIICHNPLEQDKNEIVPMTFGEFCNELNYDKSHLNRLLNVYKRIKFEWRGKQQLFAAFIYEKNKEDMKIFINPNIFYAGENFDKIEFWGIFFNNKDNSDVQKPQNKKEIK